MGGLGGRWAGPGRRRFWSFVHLYDVFETTIGGRGVFGCGAAGGRWSGAWPAACLCSTREIGGPGSIGRPGRAMGGAWRGDFGLLYIYTMYSRPQSVGGGAWVPAGGRSFEAPSRGHAGTPPAPAPAQQRARGSCRVQAPGRDVQPRPSVGELQTASHHEIDAACAGRDRPQLPEVAAHQRIYSGDDAYDRSWG